MDCIQWGIKYRKTSRSNKSQPSPNWRKFAKRNLLPTNISDYYKNHKKEFNSASKSKLKIRKIYEDSMGLMNKNNYKYIFVTDIIAKKRNGKSIGGQANKIGGYYLCLFEARQEYTIVHELGHLLNLEHTFPMKDENGKPIIKQDSTHDIPEGTTNNFMDYSILRNMFFLYQMKILNSN